MSLPGPAARAARVVRPEAGVAPAIDRLLSAGAIALLVAMLLALARGHAQWGVLTPAVWAHLATVAIALVLTPAILTRPKGDPRHRLLGRAWCAVLVATALVSFGIRFNAPGQLSWIHLLSVTTLVLVGAIVASARAHRVRLHRGLTRATALLTLLVAGFFTFPFGRLLGRWLLG